MSLKNSFLKQYQYKKKLIISGDLFFWLKRSSLGTSDIQGCYSPKEITYTSSTAQGGGGSFKNRKPIGEVGCCESGMAERSHCWSER